MSFYIETMASFEPNNFVEQAERKDSPLLEKKILVTRPGSQGESFAKKLAQLGAKPILMPLIEINEPDSWHDLDSAIANIEEYKWILFASSNAVISFSKRLKNHAASNSSLYKLPNIAVMGEATADIAKSFNLPVHYCPNNFLAENFIAQFPGYPNDLQNIKMLWPRTNHGRNFIAEKLTAAGADIHIVAAYKTELPQNAAHLSKQLQTLIANKQIDIITLASKQTAINLFEILSKNAEYNSGLSLMNTLQDILIVTIGPETSEGALNYLGRVDKEAKQHSTEGIIHALIELLNEEKQ